MPALSGWPSLTDDSGDGVSGTEIEKSVFDDIKAAIEDQVWTTNNTTVKPKTITDEVIAARGNEASLDARLSGVIDDDGNLLTPASLVTETILQEAIGLTNLAKNDTFIIWPAGDTSAPAYFTNSGSTLARCGNGLSDTTRKVGPFCVSLTNAGTMYQEVLDSGVWSVADQFEGLEVSLGCWVKSSIASHARIQITDSATTTSSSYHTGGGSWEWLTVTHTVSASASYLRFQFNVASNGTAYFSGPNFVLSDQEPTRWRPAPTITSTLYFPFRGVPTVENGRATYVFQRPAIIRSVYAYAATPTSGTTFTIDIEKGNGDATWASIFSAGSDAILNDGKRFGVKVPDSSTYSNYNFSGIFDDAATSVSGAVLRLNIDAAAVVADGFVQVRCLQWANPLESLLAHDDIT